MLRHYKAGKSAPSNTGGPRRWEVLSGKEREVPRWGRWHYFKPEGQSSLEGDIWTGFWMNAKGPRVFQVCRMAGTKALGQKQVVEPAVKSGPNSWSLMNETVIPGRWGQKPAGPRSHEPCGPLENFKLLSTRWKTSDKLLNLSEPRSSDP